MSVLTIVLTFSVLGGILVGLVLTVTSGFDSKTHHHNYFSHNMNNKFEEFDDKVKYRKYGV